MSCTREYMEYSNRGWFGGLVSAYKRLQLPHVSRWPNDGCRDLGEDSEGLLWELGIGPTLSSRSFAALHLPSADMAGQPLVAKCTSALQPTGTPPFVPAPQVRQ